MHCKLCSVPMGCSCELMTVTSELGLWSLKELSVHFDNLRSFVERITFFSLNILPPVQEVLSIGALISSTPIENWKF